MATVSAATAVKSRTRERGRPTSGPLTEHGRCVANQNPKRTQGLKRRLESASAFDRKIPLSLQSQSPISMELLSDMNTISDQELRERYPSPLLRGARISRIGEKYLGPVWTTPETCRMLGEEQVGWFIGGVPSIERMVDRIRQLNVPKAGGRWIVIPATKQLAEVVQEQWVADDELPSALPGNETLWHEGVVTFCVPESLSRLSAGLRAAGTPVAGIILLDPYCFVHKGRAYRSGKFRTAHDRPQLIVDFRMRHSVGRWSPPLMVMSLHRAAAVPCAKLRRVYCLEALQYIDGNAFSCRPIPASSGVSPLIANCSAATQ